MGKKPGGDLGTMGISKDQAAAAVPFVPAAEPAPPSVVTADKSLTVKLRGDLYEALRDYCHDTGKVTGTRVTHQEVMVEALKSFLAASKG